LARDQVLFAEVELTVEPNPAQERPAVAEATLDVNGRPVRAHVAGQEMFEAIDLLESRLARRLKRYEEKVHRQGRERHRTGMHEDGTWRHGDLPTQRPGYFDRPYDERELVRTKTLGLTPMTVDEAAFDLDMLGHDFYLFTELNTGADSVIYFRDGTSLGIRQPEGVTGDPTAGSVTPVEQAPPAPTLVVSEAIEQLEAGAEPFVFFVDSATDRGAVVYHRYDGHWGLVTATHTAG
jgi:ribosomal subunit interface protein